MLYAKRVVIGKNKGQDDMEDRYKININHHLVPCWMTAFPVCMVINNTMLHFMHDYFLRKTFSCDLLLRFTLF